MRVQSLVQNELQEGSTLFRAARDELLPLPVHAFDSLAFQRKEDAAIWTRTWVGIGFLAEIARPGDVLPFSVGNHGIHVERLENGSLAARFNKAQHGGCRTVPLQCQTGARTRCSFTACGYSYDRGPIAADEPDRPRHLDQYLGMRPERLLPVELRRWGPLLLARLDSRGEIEPDWSKPSQSLLSLDDVGGRTAWQEYHANWKYLVLALALGCGHSNDHAALLFPNVVVRERADTALIVILQPVAPARTLCRIRMIGGRGDIDVPHGIAAEARLAEAVQAGRATLGAMEDNAIRRSFEKRVSAAITALATEQCSEVLFRTADKGERY